MNHVKKKTYSIFTKNTAKVNSAIANILAFCSIAILFMVVLSAMGFFEFGTAYACIIIAGGVLVCLMPKVLVRFLPDCAMKHGFAVCRRFMIHCLCGAITVIITKVFA